MFSFRTPCRRTVQCTPCNVCPFVYVCNSWRFICAARNMVDCTVCSVCNGGARICISISFVLILHSIRVVLVVVVACKDARHWCCVVIFWINRWNVCVCWLYHIVGVYVSVSVYARACVCVWVYGSLANAKAFKLRKVIRCAQHILYGRMMALGCIVVSRRRELNLYFQKREIKWINLEWFCSVLLYAIRCCNMWYVYTTSKYVITCNCRMLFLL